MMEFFSHCRGLGLYSLEWFLVYTILSVEQLSSLRLGDESMLE